uniref:F-box domain-containing protein n=1 Tax=Hordeum vulgare subsp. vulgare TaxID=112509 RepID=A0A8I6XNV7_HORVV
MGNMLTFMLGTTAVVDNSHPRQHHHPGASSSSSNRIAGHQFEPLSILAFRAMSEHIGRSEGISANDPFKLCGILIFGVLSDYILYGVEEPAIDLLGDLPEGVLCTVFSKLSLEEALRTSAVSRKWRYLWTVCPKLSFDGDTICGKNNYGERVYNLVFSRIVNRVLGQCRGKLVEELEIKIELNWMLVEHLDNWVRFAVSSRTKALVFDLAREQRQPPGSDDQYKFPFELLDGDSICRLQKLHLSFVDFQPPMHFSGFPNLRKLDLSIVNVSGKDIQHMLSNCCNLEWLSIVRCHLNGELKVNGPLPHLLYLKIASCRLTNIAFNAVNLATFEYRGVAVPIDLSKSSELKCANIWYLGDTLEHTITVLGEVLINVQQLTHNADCKSPEVPCLMSYPFKFSRMTYLQLKLVYVEEIDSLSLVSFLRSAPSIEKLELHFCNVAYERVVQEPKPMRKLSERLFNDMKSLHITGFEACKGEVEFLLHMVENAPALEFLCIDHSYQYPPEGLHKDKELDVDLLHTTIRRHLKGKISPSCTLILL